MSSTYDQVEIRSGQQWRTWLSRHHASSPGIWLVTYKKGHGPHVTAGELVDVALCFGWVDSQPRALDDDRSQRLLTPRKKGSNWSRVNKTRVARLAEDGLMTPAGLAAVAAAKKDGSWTALDDVENLVEPDALRDSLAGDPGAAEHWAAFPRSTKRAILEWINTAKTDATRTKRITQTVTEAAQGRRANQWRQPGKPPR